MVIKNPYFAELHTFEGSGEEPLRYCMPSWWEHLGFTKASGIPKLIMIEAGNFPELARFYQNEVQLPGIALIKGTSQRGVDRKAFVAVAPVYAA